MVSPSTSEYALATVHVDEHSSTPLLPLDGRRRPAYGAVRAGTRQDVQPSSSRLLFHAAIRMATVFVLSTILLGGILWIALPTLDENDRSSLHIPKSFDDLQALNALLKKYRDIYPYRIVICYVITYLFLQAFSLPGSMYLSILGGAVWGIPRALPLACTCVATGASLCYLISAAFGPALLTVPKWKDRLDKWSLKLASQRENIISFLIVLRIAPLPPHWVINVVCPHVGIGLVPFWTSTWLGVFGVTVIHTTIGSGLDEMTSAADFHLISWKNFLLLSAVVVGVLIPVGLRYYFKREIASVADVENGQDEELLSQNDDRVLAVSPMSRDKKRNATPLVPLSDDEGSDTSFDDSEDEDVILEAGPAIVRKSPADYKGPGSVDRGDSSRSGL
ncbi:hypothetical protein ID866_2720 [Astraeus odoratus]|nr:hypothetical protein ID866_2720 [Astraeus odoratus]